MPHCQICLCPLPQHAVNCPVATGEPVPGTDMEWVQRMPQGPSGQLMNPGQWQLQCQHDPAGIELRIERLEKEVALLRLQLVKLERSGDAY